jgi:microcystin-dependent protein
MADPFVAEIRIFAGNFAPRGWAFCDGQLMQLSQNTALFSLLGTIYGGDGKTNFALPNLPGRAPMQPGQGPGLSLRDLGESGGSETATLSASEMPAHTHGLLATPGATQANPDAGQGLGNAPMYQVPGTLVSLGAGALGPTGGNLPHNNMQPYLTLNFIIALQGVFPPRS